MRARPRPAGAERIDDDFLCSYERLARASGNAVAALAPDVAAAELHQHLLALGMPATIIIQNHIQVLADNRYRLVVQSGTRLETTLVVQSRRTNSQSGFNLRLIWNELLYVAPNYTELKPDTVALLAEHLSSSALTTESDRLLGFYSLLSTRLREPPYDAELRRIAHVPIMLLDVHAEGRHGNPDQVNAEAQRRLAELYGSREEIAVAMHGPSALNA